MAVDTRAKRASAVSLLLPFVLAPLTPDGTIGQLDRQHIAWAYAGISAEVGGGGPFDSAGGAVRDSRSRMGRGLLRLIGRG